MKLACLVATTLLGACVDPGPHWHPTDPDAATLPSDAHYVMIPNGYASPEECLANAEQPFSCLYSLTFCENGRAGERTGDIVREGHYAISGPIAQLVFNSPGDGTLEFDLQAVAEVGNPNAHWIVDTEQRWNTLQFDNISCR